MLFFTRIKVIINHHCDQKKGAKFSIFQKLICLWKALHNLIYGKEMIMQSNLQIAS